MTDTSAKKDTQKLQRAIVDALEDVKAQEIVVFDTEHMSPLFERVIIASGTSNRQTKALAASVRDKVREAGYPKPRIEGEDNGLLPKRRPMSAPVARQHVVILCQWVPWVQRLSSLHAKHPPNRLPNQMPSPLQRQLQSQPSLQQRQA